MSDANGLASPMRQADERDMGMTDVIQKLDAIRNEFTTKIDVVLRAVQDVERDVQDFSLRMDETEMCISKIENTVNSEKVT